MIGLIRPKKPDYIPLKTWINLKHKEQDYLYLISLENKVPHEDIKRMLYISTDRGLKILRKRCLAKLENFSNKAT